MQVFSIRLDDLTALFDLSLSLFDRLCKSYVLTMFQSLLFLSFIFNLPEVEEMRMMTGTVMPSLGHLIVVMDVPSIKRIVEMDRENSCVDCLVSRHYRYDITIISDPRHLLLVAATTWLVLINYYKAV